MSDTQDIMPSRPQTISMRPLSKGIVANASPNQVPMGAGREVFNLYPRADGLYRRDGFQPLITKKGTQLDLGQLPMAYVGIPTVDETIQDIVPFFDSTGAYRLVAITNKRLYHCTGNGLWTVVPYGAVSYIVTSTDATHLVCAAANFDTSVVSPFLGDRVIAGDLISCKYSGVSYELPVVAVSGGSLQIASHPGSAGTMPDGNVITIVREFQLTTPYLVDYTYMTDRMVIVDGSNRGVWTYDGDTLIDLKVHGLLSDPDQVYLHGAQTCLFFNGLLFLGKTVESDIDGLHSIRFSSATDISEFSQTNYIRFNRESSPVLKLSAVEDVPIVYLEAAIYAGFPSDLTGLPYQFDKVESGNISACGMRAMCPSIGGQVFISYNNIYLLAPTKTGVRQQPEVQPIGNLIAAKSANLSLEPSRSRAYFDPEREALVFTFCTKSGDATAHTITSMMYYFTESKAWGECEAPAMSAVNVMPYTDSLVWATVGAWLLTVGSHADQWDNTALAQQQWYGLRSSPTKMQTVFASKSGILYRLEPSADSDCFDGSTKVGIKGVFESGEMDFDMIDTDKIFSWLTTRVSDVPTLPRSGDLRFRIETSSKRGVWHDRGKITIEAGTYEEDSSFRERGSLIAFRCSFDDIQEPFRIDEFGMRIRLAGQQVTRGP